ncbi:Phospholipase A2, prokaryotic/fungal [Moelleriella libera RCEF 2490]|uniref:Phospholipase A2, prokaryotic/fungal n=1 Tax=Moelleriella libera RCEF 2490 TaxID=1081109 RepID=A0A167Z3P1_9HYPO|nr:Phospholipase A2, prokaryotic/fungal [Moelleriella libera RCEF 2490]
MRLITALSALPAVVVAAIAAPSPSGLNITEGVDVLAPQMNNTEGMDFYIQPPPQNISLPDIPNALVKAQLKHYQPRLLPAILQHLLHTISADNFVQWRKQRVPEWVDWNSVGDSNMPSNPYRFPFKAACNRYDFGIQNYSPNVLPRIKTRLDAQFKKEFLCRFQSGKELW